MKFATMAEQRRSGTFSNIFKFNSKELDTETGLYYYGARYYNPRISNWLSVDPIALWQPVQESEHYILGQHNGGYFNPKNMSVYGYTYQNPIIYVDPNGKQVYFLHGTGNWEAQNYFGSDLISNVKKDYGSFKSLQWSGSLRAYNRMTEANRLYPGVLSDVKTYIDSKTKKINNPILLLGHSHGGNVAKRMTNRLVRDLQKMVKSGELAEMPEIRLVYLNSPSEAWDSGLNYDARKFVNELPRWCAIASRSLPEIWNKLVDL